MICSLVVNLTAIKETYLTAIQGVTLLYQILYLLSQNIHHHVTNTEAIEKTTGELLTSLHRRTWFSFNRKKLPAFTSEEQSLQKTKTEDKMEVLEDFLIVEASFCTSS